jgi:hypothetical protein
MNHRFAALTMLTFFLFASGLPLRVTHLVASPTMANLLANPDFEGDFTFRNDPYSGIWAGELGVAEGWELWYDNDQSCPPYAPGCDKASYNRRPEYKGEQETARVRSGAKAQKFFTNYATHTAGFYQVVEAPPNSWVRFAIWVWAWSSDLDIPAHSFNPGDYRTYVGIDPTGGRDWASSDIQWSLSTTRHDQWEQLEVAAYTESGHVSVWTKGAPVWPVKHNDSYWDDAQLEVLAGSPTATPTPTATRTPYPTIPPTPTGHVPSACRHWGCLWCPDFAGGQTEGWGEDAGRGHIGVTNGALWLTNGASAADAFPLAWWTRAWPELGDVKLSFTFAFTNATAYGTTIGVGSAPYAGQRVLAGGEALTDIEDILSIHHRMSSPGLGDFHINLLGEPVWTGVPGDTSWHSVQLELREQTFILMVDNVERGRRASSWRPHSLYLGNPIILPIAGMWTEVSLDNLRIEICAGKAVLLPLILRGSATPQPTVPPWPTATHSPG